MKRTFFFLYRCIILFVVMLCVMGMSTPPTGYTWTQISRWKEDGRSVVPTRVRYQQQFFPNKGYDIRPHQQIRNVYPAAIVGDGNNKQTSDNLWTAIVGSEYVIGNSATLPRARDLMEDFHMNFVDPSLSDRNYYFYYYSDNSTYYVFRSSYPLTLQNGPNVGESLLTSTKLLAMGDDNSLWLDDDGSLSYYNYPTGRVGYDSGNTIFSSGPSGWVGATVASKIGNLIGYEEAKLYFLEGDNTVHVFNYNLTYVRTDELELDGDLAGQTLADLVDGNIPNAHYLGWDLGPVVAFVNPDFGDRVPVAATSYTWTQVSRWAEEARINSGPVVYGQELYPSLRYDVRPHRELRNMFPDEIVGDGNNRETSNNLWTALATSENTLGNGSSLTRSRDIMEDFQINFVNPSDSLRNYYGYYYSDNDNYYIFRISYPLTMYNGPNTGQSLINNTRVLAMGDNNSLWLDNDGTLSYYNYPGGTLSINSTKTVFPTGPVGWAGATLTSKLQYLIGYEQSQLYFLVGDSTLHVFNYDLSYVRTDEFQFDGDLAGVTLGQVVDKQIPNATYLGWDLGPIIATVDTSVPVATLDHFELDFASAALTCSPQDVIIKACANADCSELYTDSFDAVLSPSGWVGSDTITITGGTATASLRHTSPGTVSLVALSITPAALNPTLCSIDTGLLESSCNLTFADSGFVFDVPDFIAGKGASGIGVQAVKKSDSSTACVPAFANVTKTLSFWTDYISPGASGRPASLSASVNSLAVGQTVGALVPLSLSFDATGIATISANYLDAGQLRLNAVHSGSGDDLGLVMSGSDTFVSRPAGMCVSTATTCSAADNSCPKFVAAGTNFDLTVRAVAWESDGDTNYCSGNSGTPNYSATGLGISSTILSPVPENNPGVVSPNSYNHSASTSGAQDVALIESEVGVFRFSITPPSYFGYSLGTFNSEPVGRFYPDHFTVSASDVGSMEAVCSSATPFTYTGESFGWLVSPQLTITANNALGGTTQNYTLSGYQKLTAADIVLGSLTADSAALGTDSIPLSLASSFTTGSLNVLAPGQLQYDFSALDSFTYTREMRAEVAPFIPDLTLSVTSVTDSDLVGMTSSLINFTPLSNVSMRFGRLWLEDAYGPETLDLKVPLRTEFFDGTRYRINEVDDCTSFDSVNAVVTPSTLTQVAASSGTLVSGISPSSGLLLSAPVNVVGVPDTGKASVRYSAPSWLRGDYDGDGSFENPEATATFGIYRGNDRVIYWREIRN